MFVVAVITRQSFLRPDTQATVHPVFGSLLFLWVAGALGLPHERLPLCNPDLLPLNTTTDQLRLVLQTDGSISFQFSHCRIDDLFHKRDAVYRCLRGRHLLFTGDSLSRYMYLSLTYFLTYGMWLPNFSYESFIGRVLTKEKDYGRDWDLFFVESNNLVSSLSFWNKTWPEDVAARRPAAQLQTAGGKHRLVSYEVCDCHRIVAPKMVAIENRQYRLLPYSAAVERGDMQEHLHHHDVRVTYIQWFGKFDIRGHMSITVPPKNRSFYEHMQFVRQQICPEHNASFFPLSTSCLEQRFQPGHDFDNNVDFVSFQKRMASCEDPSGVISETSDCQRFEHEIWQGLGVTNVILNTGFWVPGSISNYHRSFLSKTMDAAQKYLDQSAPAHAGSLARLPLITWRETTRPNYKTFPELESENKRIEELLHGYPADVFDEFHANWLTAALHAVHMLADDCKVLLRQGAAWNDTRVQQLEAEILKKVSLAPDWPSAVPFDCTLVGDVYMDNAHFQPYGYNEVNKVFLHSVCPLGD